MIIDLKFGEKSHFIKEVKCGNTKDFEITLIKIRTQSTHTLTYVLIVQKQLVIKLCVSIKRISSRVSLFSCSTKTYVHISIRMFVTHSPLKIRLLMILFDVW